MFPSLDFLLKQTTTTTTTLKPQGRSLTPSLTGFVVADLLREHFPDFTDTGFTAKVYM